MSLRKAQKTRSYTASGSALYEAAASGDHESVMLLLLQNADVNFKEARTGNTPLHVAALLGHDRVVNLLLDHGADGFEPNNQGRVALHLAATQGIVFSLTRTASHTNPRDKNGWSPLHCAAESASSDVIEALIKTGGDPNLREYNRRWTPLFTAVVRRDPTIISALLRGGADPNAKGKGGWTALHYASMQGDYRAMWRILQAGGDPSQTQHSGIVAASRFKLVTLQGLLMLKLRFRSMRSKFNFMLAALQYFGELMDNNRNTLVVLALATTTVSVVHLLKRC